jgi:hypothetical protein
MTEAFSEAVDMLNVLAGSLEEMEENEARMISVLICDLAAFLNSEDMDVVWQIRPAPVRLQ